MWNWKTSIVVILAMLVVAGAGYFGYRSARGQATRAAQAPSTVAVTRGDVQLTVTGPGRVVGTKEMLLGMTVAGTLAEIDVRPGDIVRAGDVLAKLDTSDLEPQVAQAEGSLEQAKLKLDQLKQRPKDVDLAAAQATHDSAVTKYNDLKASPKSADVDAAKQALGNAEVALANAQDSLLVTQKSDVVSRNVRDRENEHNWYEARYGDTIAKFKEGQASQADVDRDWSNLLTAKERLDSARANAELTLRQAENAVVKAKQDLTNAQNNLQTVQAGPTQDQLKSAEAAMLSAKSELEKKTAGTSATDIASQQVAVRLAEATLNQKRQLLKQALLIAPFDGVVLDLSAKPGETVSGKGFIVLADPAAVEVKASVIEEDLPLVHVGQSVEIFFDAVPEAVAHGKVARIVPQQVADDKGRTTYPVYITLDEVPKGVLTGMTVDNSIIITQKSGVLRLPRSLVRATAGGASLDVWANGRVEKRAVQVGLRGDVYVEVVEGLNEGEQVVGQWQQPSTNNQKDQPSK